MRSTSRRSARTSRSWRARCTAFRWCTSTAPTPRRSRRSCSTPMADFYARHNANVARAVHTLGSRGDARRSRAPATRWPRSSTRPSRDEVIFTKNIIRGAEPAGVLALQRHDVPRRRAVPDRPGRRDRGHRDGAPQQPRAVAAAGPAHRRDVPLDPDRRRRPAGRVGDRRGDQRAHQGRRRSSTSPTRWARSTRSRRIVDRAQAVGALTIARRRAVRAAPAAGRAGARRRLRRRSPATSCTARPASACCGAATSCWPRCRRSSAAAR